MNRSLISTVPDESIPAVLGYLNFSSGAHDPQFFSHLNSIFRYCKDVDGLQTQTQIRSPAWRFFFQLLTDHLALLKKNTSTFENTEQAAFVLTVTYDKILPEYRNFHADLLFHQSEESLFTPFFVGRVFEAVLSCTSRDPSLDVDWQNDVLDKLNDYVGYRPVAVLENDRKAQPYPHEWCRPIPLFIRGAGVSEGVYAELISQTLDILQTVPSSLYSIAQFDLNNMVEMANDPRPYDFDHPVNKRPNYQFGMWDPLSVDNRGFYSRFVVQQVTLDILLERAKNAPAEDRTQKMFESAAALAGTILMASSVSGRSPDAYSSDVTLGTLLPIIAECREAFYSHLLGVISKQDVENC